MRLVQLSVTVTLLTCALGGWAQAAKDLRAGRVTGTVTCADTNAPARFAVVTLEPAGPVANHDETGAGTTAVTDLDGRFVLDKIPAGQYFVLASLNGYLNPLATFDKEQLKKMTDETRRRLAVMAPLVVVDPNQPAAVTVRLEHASEVSGTINYDDGSPAIGLHVQLFVKKADGRLEEARSQLIEGQGLFGAQTMTDDRGRFRMTGTAPGEYVVEVKFRSEQVAVSGVLSGNISVSISSEEGNAMAIYTGNAFRRKDAKSVKVGTDDLASGFDITIPLAALHTVRGTLIARQDGHALNRGQVELLYADDEEEARRPTVDDDGEFLFPYVPEGSYLVRSSGAVDAEVEVHQDRFSNTTRDRVTRRYGEASLPVMVQGDVSGLELAVPTAKPQS
jgi:hypothetical protein